MMIDDDWRRLMMTIDDDDCPSIDWAEVLLRISMFRAAIPM